MAHCDESLKLIGEKIAEYQKNHDGMFPPSLDTLVELEMITVWELVCPVSPFPVGQCSYFYRGADLFTGVPKEMVVAYDKVNGHKERRNILFANGRVHRPPEGVFNSFIRKDNEFRRQMNLQEIKAEIVWVDQLKHLRPHDDLEDIEE